MQSQVKRRLKGKDLITIGIFSAIYFIISFVCNIMGGLHPIIWFLSPAFTAIFGAIPYMILNSKTEKPFAVLMMGVIVGLIYFITGQFAYTVPLAFIGGSIIAELLRKASGYKSFWINALGFAFFSMGMAGSPLPLWLYSNSFIAQIREFGMPDSYINTLEQLSSMGMLILMLVATVLCAFVGALITKGLFRKHFKKAGIV